MICWTMEVNAFLYKELYYNASNHKDLLNLMFIKGDFVCLFVFHLLVF